jgi:hypothetical protein
VNVGIILYHPESKFLKSQFIDRFGRISQFFNEINGHYILTTLRNFEREISIIAKRGNDLFVDYQNINEITRSILPEDDSALECSEIFYGIDINLESAVTDLFERLVNRYCPESESETHDDKYVWKNVYKKYFDRYDLTKKLKSHSIKTAHDLIQFDKAWKNGIWHCYQAVSFDLKRSESIKNKVYKWSGILNELDQTNEKLHVHFLTVCPSKHKPLQNFIDDTITGHKSDAVRISVIKESEAEKYIESLSKEMAEQEE